MIFKTSGSLLNIFWDSIAYLLLYILLSDYVNQDGNDLKDANVLTLLALFNILIQPLGKNMF